MLALAVAGAIGGWWWQGRRDAAATGSLEQRLAAAGIDRDERAAIEGVVRDYILAHPEILPEAMERLQSKGAAGRISQQRAAIETPFAGAVLGNPNGSLTLVQFTDYACTYCRQSTADLAALVATHPELKVVVRELPILSPASEDAARMALAAAGQGRYAAFHQAMFANGKPDATSIAAAARAAGVDPAAAQAMARGGEVSGEPARNLELARQLGISGTPAWVVGDRLLIGAVGREALERALAEARGAA
jgi:protein-disulfide isomerase